MVAGLFEEMERARALTLWITEDLDDAQARARPDPDFSPIGWHLGHVAWQEEVWLHRRIWGRPPIAPEHDALFDSFRSPKETRSVRLPPLSAIREYAARVREVSARLAERDHESELLEDGWVFRFLANHERQHAEIIAIARLLLRLPRAVESVANDGATAEEGWHSFAEGSFLMGADDPDGWVFRFLANHERQHAEIIAIARLLLRLPRAVESVANDGATAEEGWHSFPEGSFLMGADDPDGWDNERRPHRRHLSSFLLARRQVTNGEWLAFIEAGGYQTRSLWSEAGWAFVRGRGTPAPRHRGRHAEGTWP